MRLFFLSIFLLLGSSKSFAWGLKELGEEVVSPVTTDAKYALYGGSALTLVLAMYQDQVGKPFGEKQVRNQTLGTSSQYGAFLGNMVGNTLYVVGMGIAGFYGDPKGYDRAIGMFKASAYSFSVTTILKRVVQEPRPSNHDERDSFPSGHANASFTFSGYVAAEHGWGWGSAALMFSSFVAYSRIQDNRHRLHDVAGGATIGWAYGWAMSRMQHKEAKARQEKEKSAIILPLLDSQTAGLTLYKEF
jgi:membrane-associated phospholipid phosphatase